MKWIRMSERKPEIKDLPFVTYMMGYGGRAYWELWEDSDWFQEIPELEQLEWTDWLKLEMPVWKIVEHGNTYNIE